NQRHFFRKSSNWSDDTGILFKIKVLQDRGIKAIEKHYQFFGYLRLPHAPKNIAPPPALGYSCPEAVSVEVSTNPPPGTDGTAGYSGSARCSSIRPARRTSRPSPGHVPGTTHARFCPSAAGVPAPSPPADGSHPDSPHTADGCRWGGLWNKR